MIFEVRKGRECSETLTASLQAISALQILNHSQGQLIELRGKEVANLKELDLNWQARLDNANETFELDKSLLKAKVKKRNKIIAGESGLLLILLALLIL